MRQSQLFSKADQKRRLVEGKTNATKKTFFLHQNSLKQLAKVVSSSAPGPPRVPEPVYSATDKHSASYAVKCHRGRHKFTTSLDLFACKSRYVYQ